MTRRGGTAGALALAALALVGCGSGGDAVRAETVSPAAFVGAVRDLVRPADRMGVVAAAALGGTGPRPAAIEVDGLVDDARRELTEFRALRLGDPALGAEQARLVGAMEPILGHMRSVRAILRADGRSGLSAATTSLLDAMRGIPSAARS